MTISEAITNLDELKHNVYRQPDKIKWLSRLDQKIRTEIIDTHEDAPSSAFEGYDESTDLNTELLVPAPYDDVYLRYMETQIDYLNGEYGRYNNSMTMFNAAYSNYERYYNRTHMPLGKIRQYF